MAQFEPANKITRRAEGFYGWFFGDRGGETYAGITRNFNPEWSGWPVVDAFKKHAGVIGTSPTNTLKNNTQIPAAEPHVDAFYLALWNKYNLSAIADQDVANIIYDFIVNSSSTAILETEQVLHNTFKSTINPDRIFNQETISEINKINPKDIFNAILFERVEFYKKLGDTPHDYTVSAGETPQSIAQKFKLSITEVPATVSAGQVIKLLTHKQFVNGWLARLNAFKAK